MQLTKHPVRPNIPLPKALRGQKEGPTPNKLHFQFASLQEYLAKHREDEKFWSYIETTASITLIVVFLVAAISPTAVTIAKLVGEIKSKEEVTAAMKVKIENLLEAQSNFSTAQNNYYSITSFLPEDPQYHQVVQTTIGCAQLAGNVKVDSVSFHTVTGENKSLGSTLTGKEKVFWEEVQTVGFDTQTQISWRNFLDWLNYMENARRFLFVKNVSIRQDAKQKEIVLATLNGEAYFWKTQEVKSE